MFRHYIMKFQLKDGKPLHLYITGWDKTLEEAQKTAADRLKVSARYAEVADVYEVDSDMQRLS